MELTPKNAWLPFEASSTSRWDERKVRHLFDRAGFSSSFAEVKRAAKLDPKTVIDQLFDPPHKEQLQKFNAEIEQLAKVTLTGNNPKSVAAWWLYRMAKTPDQLREKITLFWHGHFATSASKVNHGLTMIKQNEMLRENALGKFETLVQKVSADPAMLIYLDSTDNRKTHPNENYARELLELFCLGLDQYTENDVQELARCFTGWQVNRREFRFNPFQHDTGSKTILGQSGAFTGEKAIEIIVKSETSARFIAGKMIEYFCCDETQLDDELLAPLIEKILESDFDLGELTKTILSSNLFFSSMSFHKKILSPVELVVGLLRKTGTSINFIELVDSIEELGQLPLFPPNVKGWDGGRTWINSATLIARNNLVRRILTHSKTRWEDGNAAQWLSKNAGTRTEKQVDWLLQTFAPLAAEHSRKILQGHASSGLEKPKHVTNLLTAIAALPEFHIV